MQVEEKAVVFDVEDASLIGIIHKPEQPKKQGIIAIVAGGPQYRAGCCRQLVEMARKLSTEGYPVMRFDYRGLGDSVAEFKGFQHIQADIDAAIKKFKEQIPEMDNIILWGGCDAASAAMLHGPQNATVSGMIIANPWVYNEETHAKVVVQHYYLNRIKEKSFWLKIFKLKLNPVKTIQSVMSVINTAYKKKPKNETKNETTNLAYPDIMCKNIQNFDGHILLLMSGLSLVSKEFDQLIASSHEWKKAIDQNNNLQRVNFPDADQAFSTIAAKNDQVKAALTWLKKLPEKRIDQ